MRHSPYKKKNLGMGVKHAKEMEEETLSRDLVNDEMRISATRDTLAIRNIEDSGGR